MKTTTTSVLLLFLFITTLSSYVFGVTNATNDPVLDFDGDELRTGVEYYVVSAIWGAGGGGLALERPRRQPCPEAVVQRMSDFDDGIPVTFSNVDANDGVVYLSTDLNIEFVPIRPKFCLTSTVWQLGGLDAYTRSSLVTTGGVKGNPGPNTVNNWFKIEKAGKLGYKFKYCPSVCESCKTPCSDIGKILDFERLMRLNLSPGEGWPFLFKKAERTAKGIQQVAKA